MPSKKKIFTIVAIAAILIASGFILWRSEQNKLAELAALKAKCLEETAKISDEQMIEKIKNTISDQLELSAINKKTVSYLFCSFSDSDKSDEIYQETQSLIQSLKTSNKKIIEDTIKILTDDYEAARKNNFVPFDYSLIGMLAMGNLAKVCPEKLPNVCKESIPISLKLSSMKYYQRALAWCQDACNLITQYSENKDKLEQEVINFKEWDKNVSIREVQYSRRVALAYRFGGKEAALKVCNNLADSEGKNGCVAKVDNLVSNILSIQETEKKCASQRQEIINYICSVVK